ncbi:MAG: Sec-independent protein translocase subunit TatA [Gordonia sp. (in: high G+C Gram-positive bacteria)]
MFGNVLHPWHIVVIVVVLLVLFGSKRLPDAARGLGRSMRIFKSEVKQMQHDDDAPPQAPQSPALPRSTSTDPVAENADAADDIKKTA